MSTSTISTTGRQAVLSIGIITVLVVAGLALKHRALSHEETAPPPTLDQAVVISRKGETLGSIEVTKVMWETIVDDITATGQILYPSDRTVKISPRLTGRVQDVLVKVGDHVRVGQTLAILESVDAATAQTTALQSDNKLRLAKITVDRQERLYKLGTPEVTSAAAALAQAHTAVVVAQEALERTQQQATIGGFVDPPLEAAQNAVNAANNNLVQARSDLAQAQRDHNRKTQLVEVGVTAKSDLEASTNILEKAGAAVQSDMESAKIAEQALVREQRAFKSKLYEQQQVRAAEAAYRQAQVQETGAATAVRLARAAIQTNLQQARSDYQAALADAANSHRVLHILGHPDVNGTIRILAPISGVITDRQVSPGQIVDQSQMTPWQMFVLSDTSQVWVDADVFEKDIAAVTPGCLVRIRVSALPNQEFRGVVQRIAPTLDKTARAVKVRAELANRAGLLKDGMYASVVISPGKKRQALTIPASAVQHDGDSDFVFVPQNGKYVRRHVETGPHFNDRYVVTAGLREGEAVVAHGAIFLDNQLNGG